MQDVWLIFYFSVLRDPDSNPYSLLEGESELADADMGDGMGGDRRRRSRRRRNDQEPSVMDAAAESDGQAGPSENGLGEGFRKMFEFSYAVKSVCSELLHII